MTRHGHAIRIAGQVVEERFVRAAGPRGRNPRHEASAVELRVNVAQAPLTDEARRRLLSLARAQVTRSGVLIITARRSSSQVQNRQAARSRLASLLRRAAMRPARRLESDRPQRAREARLTDKHLRSARKHDRHTRQRTRR